MIGDRVMMSVRLARSLAIYITKKRCRLCFERDDDWFIRRREEFFNVNARMESIYES